MPHAHVAFCCFAKRRRVLPNALIVLAFHAVAFVFALAIGFGKMVRRTYVHLRAKGWLLTGGRKGAHGADGYPKGTARSAAQMRWAFGPPHGKCLPFKCCAHARTHRHTRRFTYARVLRARTHRDTRAHTHTHRHTHTHTHTQTHTHTHTHTHSLTHSHAHKHARTHPHAHVRTHTRVRTRLLGVTNVQVVPTAEQLGWMGLSAISMEVAQAAMTSLLNECTCASIRPGTRRESTCSAQRCSCPCLLVLVL
jgi:hypothetical protein